MTNVDVSCNGKMVSHRFKTRLELLVRVQPSAQVDTYFILAVEGSCLMSADV